MNQAGMILALILLSIPAEMVKRSKASKASKASKRSKSSKPSQYNTIQYNTIQYNTIQYNTIQYSTIQSNTITREYRTKVRPCPPGSLCKEKAPGSEEDTGGNSALIPLSRLPGSPGPDNRC